MDLSGDIPLRGGTKSCVGHAEQPLVEKEPRRDGRRREDRPAAWATSPRTPAAEFRTQDTDYFCEPSGYPRFCEGARYWLQWAGFPETVYRQKEGLDDYKEDYMSRAHWVNALMGGSERLPDEEGLNIPVDMALAFHSDAGVRRNDETIGTLGIYFTQENGGRFEGGAQPLPVA